MILIERKYLLKVTLVCLIGEDPSLHSKESISLLWSVTKGGKGERFRASLRDKKGTNSLTSGTAVTSTQPESKSFRENRSTSTFRTAQEGQSGGHLAHPCGTTDSAAFGVRDSTTYGKQQRNRSSYGLFQGTQVIFGSHAFNHYTVQCEPQHHFKCHKMRQVRKVTWMVSKGCPLHRSFSGPRHRKRGTGRLLGSNAIFRVKTNL